MNQINNNRLILEKKKQDMENLREKAESQVKVEINSK